MQTHTPRKSASLFRESMCGFRSLARRCASASFALVPEILVVDDSRVMREMVVACLRVQSGMTFTHAASGLEALERLSLKQFDLVVLDLNMPDIGGYEVLEFLRGQDKLRDLPVLVVTTRGDEGSKARALESGASSFLTKPFSPDVILAEVRTLLSGPAAAGAG
jgi:two-component system chemotaxis response regulator CheY